jgi:2-methylcitrate dehydratase PrpD
MREDIALILAKHVSSTEYRDIPVETVKVTKQFILDTLGVTIAGGTLGDGPRQILDLLRDWGGKPESTILGFGDKVPSPMATFANGAMAHALDYDDCLDTGFVHPGVTVIPPVLAIAERLGKVSGKELITAVALGYDIICRLAHSVALGPVKWQPTWMPTCLLGVFSSAAACGKLLKLDDEGIADAFGIALNQAGGTFEMAFSPTANVRAIYAGFPAETGLRAALLAQKGITAAKTSLEGRTGLYKMYFNGQYDPNEALDRLGKRYEINEVSIKPWPSCRASHTYIEAGLELTHRHNIKPEEISQVILHVAEFSQTLCQPLPERRRPRTSTAAKFSIPFAIAAAIVYHEVKLRHFTPEGLKDERILEVAQKISSKFDTRCSKATGEPPALIELKTRSGKVLIKEITEPYGSPQRPMSLEQIIIKFQDCIAYAPVSTIKNNVNNIIDIVSGLEDLDDISELTGLLGG